MGSLSEEVRTEVLCGYICDLEADNAELRKLCADMWFWSYEGHMNSKSQEWQMKHIDEVLNRMRKLRVEVTK